MPDLIRKTDSAGVRNLRNTAESLGHRVKDYRLLDSNENPLNPGGVIQIEKSCKAPTISLANANVWRCPLMYTSLSSGEIAFISTETGLLYPVLKGIPLLCRDHVILASAFDRCESI
jgi:hypothetical protein